MDAMRERWGGVDGNEFQLNAAGLTIAAQADEIDRLRAALRECRDALLVPDADATGAAIDDADSLLGDSNE